MTDHIAVSGTVGTPPRHIVTEGGVEITSFRLASAQRRFDRRENAWVETNTNWYTVTAFRQLAQNARSSLAQGERVVVSGRVLVRAWQSGDRSGTSIEIEAESIGHDLAWGTTSLVKTVQGAEAGAVQGGSAPGIGGGSDGGWSVPGAPGAAGSFLPAGGSLESVAADAAF